MKIEVDSNNNLKGFFEDEKILPNFRYEFDELIPCEGCGKDLAFVNGTGVDGSILGVCIDCAKAAGLKI